MIEGPKDLNKGQNIVIPNISQMAQHNPYTREFSLN